MENPHSVQDIASIRECQRGYTEGYIVELLKNVFLGVGGFIVLAISLAGVADLLGLFRGRRSKND